MGLEDELPESVKIQNANFWKKKVIRSDDLTLHNPVHDGTEGIHTPLDKYLGQRNFDSLPEENSYN